MANNSQRDLLRLTAELEDLSLSELDKASPTEVLSRMLNPGATFAEESSLTAEDRDQLVEIAKSDSATVYKAKGWIAIKKMHPNYSNLPEEQMAYDMNCEAVMAQEAAEDFKNHAPTGGIPVKVPQGVWTITDWKGFWHRCMDRLPPQDHTDTPAFKMNLILPMPETVRRALVCLFHPHSSNSLMDPVVVKEIANRAENRHCLVRPCLGMVNISRSAHEFSLRNFDLSVRDMESLGMRVDDFARAIGEAFALLHYRSELSGGGVQFALGTSQTNEGSHKTIDLYLLGFGKCAPCVENDHDDNICNILRRGMLTGETQRFIPSPQSPRLFGIFKAAYLERGERESSRSAKGRAERVMKLYESDVSKRFG
ncbi:hypothetical protein NM208_g13633 [Fusarium decemcellulare]|uniref:Uncharacterized protein n=1 Tax=Fusarium decemcellulare TaxID=57161 RepID=A0ACC1RJ19_9HYPO|nr:hypothetical protein NM208_g13633 [Fusarium decemcellulare]